MKKRDIPKASQNVCEASSSLCKYYYPDHPDTSLKRDILKASQNICLTSSSLCTYNYPDHRGTSLKIGKYSPTVTHEMLQNDPSIKMTGIPTSCKNLQQLGHSLNGLYLIKKSLSNNPGTQIQSSQPDQGTKIETVFCNFQSEGEKTYCSLLSSCLISNRL